MKRWLALLVSASITSIAGIAAAETVGTLTLDGLSYVSFQDEEVLPLASGTIRFRFGEPLMDGSVPFKIGPEDVSIPEIALERGGSLAYELASPVSGVMQTTLTGRMIAFTAQVDATFTDGNHRGTLRYTVPFTTESVSATSRDGEDHVEASGMRAVDGALYVRVVGASVNRSNAVPKPGTAVYTVLSGQFDQLP